jgi:stearoyl-CoA desaturase (delta-9 desaturase)
MSTELAELLARGPLAWSVPALALWFVVVAQLTILSVTLYLHRSQAHRGVDFHPAIAHFFRFWAWLTTAMVTKEWVAIHRKHHARCETDEDPHSPKVYGLATVAFHGVSLYRKANRDRAMIEQYGVGAPNDRIERWVYGRFPEAGPTLLLFVCVGLFGAAGLALWALQMLVIPVCAAGVINGLGHAWGYRNFETNDLSTNLTPWAFLLGGEELHNNHHAFPSSAKFALRRFEFDLGWAVLRGLERLGLAKVLRVAPKLEQRAVALPDAETVRALLAHRFAVMTGYFREVIAPQLREEARQAQDSLGRLGSRLRRALERDGRFDDAATRERLAEFVRQRPLLAAVVEYRQRLNAVLERSGKNSEALLESLKAWCADAERSGIATLANFARAVKGYALVPARAG